MKNLACRPSWWEIVSVEGWGINILWITRPRMTGDPITKSIIDCNRNRSGRSRTWERCCARIEMNGIVEYGKTVQPQKGKQTLKWLIVTILDRGYVEFTMMDRSKFHISYNCDFSLFIITIAGISCTLSNARWFYLSKEGLWWERVKLRFYFLYHHILKYLLIDIAGS